MGGMTGSEQITLARFREDVGVEFKAVREELQQSRTDLRKELREEFGPALDFYHTVNSVGRALKWGVGIGASIVTIMGGLKVMGVFG
jgi:hypothetical protein